MLLLLLLTLLSASMPPGVRVERLPEGALQPRIAVDAAGTVHLVYFQGDPAAGDLFYTRRPAGAEAFGEAIRVNHHDGSAVAVGTIRGAQMAVGPDGRVHVMWNGARDALPRGPHDGAPLLYTRLNAAGTAFEPERNVAQFAGHLDGGGAVTVDAAGDVSVVWHGDPEGAGEAARAVYVARSSDGGRTFAREVRVSPETMGVCGCCGLQAWAGSDGRLRVLYRATRGLEHRDMVLLTEEPAADAPPFHARLLDPWNTAACPMSSSAFAERDGRVIAAWQTGEQVFWQPLVPDARKQPLPDGPHGQKHPSLAVGAGGEMLVAWTEGTGWKRGGSVAWQRYDAQGRPVGPVARAEGLPAWSFPAAYADGDAFVVLY